MSHHEPEQIKNHQLTRLIELAEAQLHVLHAIAREVLPPVLTPTKIQFQEITMLPTIGGNTLVYTGTLAPLGAQYPADTTFTVSSNDSAVMPTVDATGLIVTIPLPSGWVESTSTPLAIAYAAASASNPGWAVSANITPSAPVALPAGITFVQTA